MSAINGLKYPSPLKHGDKVAIISPASVVRPEFIDQAADFIRGNRLKPVVMPHAKGVADGSYAASVSDRLSDLLTAWNMPDVKAVVCSRGGYGAVHLLPLIPGELLSENPKWLVGFSDISALHALSLSQGVASIHGPMTRDFRPDCEGGMKVMEMLLSGRMPDYSFLSEDTDAIPDNIEGEARGKLIGGNLAVLNGLAGTPFDLLSRPMAEDCILFIEDISEPIYKIERILFRLYMQGVFSRLKGLLVGHFTETSPDRNHISTERMIERFLNSMKLSDLPVAYNFPVGHFPGNMPVIEGAEVSLTVGKRSAVLTSVAL